MGNRIRPTALRAPHARTLYSGKDRGPRCALQLLGRPTQCAWLRSCPLLALTFAATSLAWAENERIDLGHRPLGHDPNRDEFGNRVGQAEHGAGRRPDDRNRARTSGGGGFGKIFHIGSQPMNASLQAFDYPTHSSLGPSWAIRFQVQFLFPR